MQTRPPLGTLEENGQPLADDLQFVTAVSPVMRAVEQAIEDVAQSSVPVLLVGEAGTGKRILARRIHQLSSRQARSFREMNCANLSLESFPAAVGNGGASAAFLSDAGTVFFTDIADLVPSCQSSLLRVFLDGNGSGPRVIASTRRNLEQEIRAGRFREDLYYRISGVCLRIPPLRHRKEDIPTIAEHFLEKYSVLFGRPQPKLSSHTLRFFAEHTWPGNVRELEDAARTIAAVGDERVAIAALRSAAMAGHRPDSDSPVLPLKEAARAASRQAERELILKVLARNRWNRKRAAEDLQISYKALLYKLKQIGMDQSAETFFGREDT